MRVCCYALTLALIGVLTVCIVHVAHGHKAPSGWEYPPGCCSGDECRRIACGNIKTDSKGGATWMGIHFTKEQVKTSGDLDCHACLSSGPSPADASVIQFYPHCIYLSPTN